METIFSGGRSSCFSCTLTNAVQPSPYWTHGPCSSAVIPSRTLRFTRKYGRRILHTNHGCSSQLSTSRVSVCLLISLRGSKLAANARLDSKLSGSVRCTWFLIIITWFLRLDYVSSFREYVYLNIVSNSMYNVFLDRSSILDRTLLDFTFRKL